ncbi:nucleotidyltransferase family protein [Planococcus lenghuensis]|uniref:Nucleotidyltransferase family protein n=1 Tax=Planococcus lenghuensis TaxID=2213202 RepID=A0A1Q2L6A6_9BACL|nr:nucleotidyltransferase family protein [Planococcus lenghuensis]AQQ55617.1 hypothetical protein B0X71_20490 [Planococcus lenghuensis]
MMEILKTVQTLNLPDWWVCAGFVRSKIWDTLHEFEERTHLPDIDVFYFDDRNTDEEDEKRLERELKITFPDVPWSVKNEARMHIRNNLSPYASSKDAMAKFPETVTALGVKLDGHSDLMLFVPYGVEDVLNLEVRPTPYYLEGEDRLEIYRNRVASKNWQQIWHKVKVLYPQITGDKNVIQRKNLP